MNELTEEQLTSYSAFRITSADTDMFARIKAGGLFNLLIQAAIDSAEKLGFGFKNLKEQKLYWVLSRLTVEIYKPLIWNQEAIVETWPKSLDRLLYMRDYLVRDKEQNIVARATSGWLAIDTLTKKPKIIDGIQSEMFVHLHNKHGLKESPEKMSGHASGDCFEMQSKYFDYDLNRHVTSTRYVDWMMDTFPVDFHKHHFPKKISINFMKETLPGDTLTIIRGSDSGNLYNFEGTNQTHNTIAFRGKIEF